MGGEGWWRRDEADGVHVAGVREGRHLITRGKREHPETRCLHEHSH